MAELRAAVSAREYTICLYLSYPDNLMSILCTDATQRDIMKARMIAVLHEILDNEVQSNDFDELLAICRRDLNPTYLLVNAFVGANCHIVRAQAYDTGDGLWINDSHENAHQDQEICITYKPTNRPIEALGYSVHDGDRVIVDGDTYLGVRYGEGLGQ